MTACALFALASTLAAEGTVAAQSAPPPVAVPNVAASAVPGAGTAPSAPTAIPVLSAPTDEPAPAPQASATPGGKRRGRGKPAAAGSAAPAGTTPEPTPTPTAPGFATLDGTWEVQLQHPDSTDYSYLAIKQSGMTLTGSWKNKKSTSPFEDGNCTFDGKLIRIVAKTATGDVTFSGYVENGTDMVGTLDAGGKTDPTPFTAAHRAKDKGLFAPGLTPAGVPLPNAGSH